MAAPYNPPKRAEDFVTAVFLESMSATGQFQNGPTIAAGDVQISKDFGTFANLTTLPVVTPAATRQLKIEISATEMTADIVSVQGHDQTIPPEWADFAFCIPTTA